MRMVTKQLCSSSKVRNDHWIRLQSEWAAVVWFLENQSSSGQLELYSAQVQNGRPSMAALLQLEVL